MNICEHLTTTARIFPDQIAIQFEGSSFTYAQLNHMSLSASQVLTATGVQPGDRVGIWLGNVPAFAVWYFASLRIGAVAVSISTRAADPEVAFFLNDCEAGVLVCDESYSGEFKLESSDTTITLMKTYPFGEVVSCERVSDQEEAEARVANSWYDAQPDDPALILYTSGTTGFPKGATLSHGNVRSNVCAFNHLCNMQPQDRILLAVPLFHCFGQNALLNSALNVGATIILQQRFDLNETKRLIQEHSVTQFYGVPVMFQLLMDACTPEDLSSIHYCFSAAATMPISVAQNWQKKFQLPIHEGYGLTETSPFASYNHRLKFVPGSIGTPIDSVEMRIVDTESGQPCPPGELGEIAIRGPNVMLGYWNRQEETEAVVKDGWFHSGDIGRQDENGYFYIVDRVKDMISVGGLKVFPAEVERVILELPDVKEVAVVGVPDQVFGEQVIAYVVLDSENSSPSVLAGIKNYTSERVAKYKVPRLVIRLDELPRNPSGKVLKRELRERELVVDLVDPEKPSESSQTELHAPTLRKKLSTAYASEHPKIVVTFIQKYVQQLLEIEEVPDPEERFLDIGLDSLMIVEVSNQIQHELGPTVKVPATLLFDHPRLIDLSEYLLSTIFPDLGESQNLGVIPETQISDKTDIRAEVESLSEEDALAELMKELEQE